MPLGLRQKNRPLKEGGFNLSLRIVVMCLIMLTLTGIFYAYSSVRALNLSYQTSQALQVQHELLETGRRLKVELSNLRSMERLEGLAASHALVKPGPQQVRKIQ